MSSTWGATLAEARAAAREALAATLGYDSVAALTRAVTVVDA